MWGAFSGETGTNEHLQRSLRVLERAPQAPSALQQNVIRTPHLLAASLNIIILMLSLRSLTADSRTCLLWANSPRRPRTPTIEFMKHPLHHPEVTKDKLRVSGRPNAGKRKLSDNIMQCGIK